MINIFNNFREKCAKSDDNFNKRLQEVQVEGLDDEDGDEGMGFDDDDNPMNLLDSLSKFEDEDYLLFRPEELPNQEY